MTDRITELALQAGAARFYPDRQAVTPDSYLVGQEFLQRFAELVRNEALEKAAFECEKECDNWDNETPLRICAKAIRSLK